MGYFSILLFLSVLVDWDLNIIIYMKKYSIYNSNNISLYILVSINLFHIENNNLVDSQIRHSNDVQLSYIMISGTHALTNLGSKARTGSYRFMATSEYRISERGTDVKKLQ